MLQTNGLDASEANLIYRSGVIEQGCLVHLQPGRYLVQAQLRSFFLDDPLFPYDNNAPDEQAHPFTLDVEHARCVAVLRGLLADLESVAWDPHDISVNGVAVLMQILDRHVQRTLKNRWADDHASRLSDVLAQGETACGGKCTAAAALLVAAVGYYTPVTVQLVNGHIGSIAALEQRDYGHVWMRAEFRNAIALYDPFYGQLEVFPADTTRLHPTSAFRSRLLDVPFMLPFVNEMGGGVPDDCRAARIVGGKLLVYPDDDGAVQCRGKMTLEVATRFPGDLLLAHGAIFQEQLSSDGQSLTRLLYPLENLARVES